MTPLTGHTSPETAYVVADYPYGFRLRCQMRYWIETKPGHGQRLMQQTTDPKFGNLTWNKPKASTYSAVRALALNDEGRVVCNALSTYVDANAVAAFEAIHPAETLDANQRATLAFLKEVQRRLAARAEVQS